jgi:hypothetical protein
LLSKWITQLDLMLLYPDYRPIVTAERVEQDYSEDEDLSREEKDSEGDSSNNLRTVLNQAAGAVLPASAELVTNGRVLA